MLSMALTVKNKIIPTNKDGFLLHQEDWCEDVGIALAKAHSVELTESHWEILRLLRDYCQRGNEPPSMRNLSAEIKLQLEADKARSIYLMKLFGSSPAKMASRLAGLPKPKNCL